MTMRTNTHRKHTVADKLRAAKAANRPDSAPHVVVVARAGTGKTTTLVEGIKKVTGKSVTIVPSPQQTAVWEVMKQSKGGTHSICFVAFNKSIATELQERVPDGCNAMTMHSLGFKAVTRAFGKVRVNSYRVQDIISELLERDIRELRKRKMEVLNATEKLVGLCKMNLVGTDTNDHAGDWADGEGFAGELSTLASYYDVDLNGNAAEVFDLVPKVLECCKDVQRDGCIDFSDMIWIPVALELSVYKYDLLLVDEAQDLSRCQQELAMKAGRRLILCGDPKQAIYGFAGADSESMSRMTDLLGATDRGVVTLPLTVTRRCGKAIVAEAQKIVPDFEAFESNGEGLVSRAEYKGDLRPCENESNTPCRQRMDTICPACEANARLYTSQVQDGDMCLCRVNAPLVSQCFRFLKAGRKANIQGLDVGQGLIGTIKKFKVTTVVDIVDKLSEWRHHEVSKEQRKRNPNDSRLIAIEDRYDCLMCFAEDVTTVDEVTKKIESVFTDDRNNPGIKLSSIHKAKGLEAKRVFLLEPEGATVPHPMAKSKWQREQEFNLRYVGITRAIEELVYVS